jgi:two-component system CheB/CheR fusion protein
LLKRRPAGDPLRVWVAGCSTGEEAYSLAILMREGMDKLKQAFPLQIFGTDLDDGAIETARCGFYPEGIGRDVGPRRLARFFTRIEGGYRIKPEIRELVIFAKQDVLQDPPFTRLDLIACRNLLIYVRPAAQQRILTLFHYSLKPAGVLMLGTSEGLAGLDDHFMVMNKKLKIFSRRATRSGRALPAVFTPVAARSGAAPVDSAVVADRNQQRLLSSVIEKALVTRYAPASVIVNERGDIFYINGHTGDYLEPAIGQPRLNVLEMAREGLRLELPAMLRRAAGKYTEIVREGIPVKMNSGFAPVRLTVTRLSDPETVRGLLLVTFQPEPVAKAAAAGKPTRRASADPARPGRVSELERELRYARETLQSTNEELQTANEDLKTTNEELQSTNEELQSTNEELETSKEEMQSLNEELQTVNAELKTKLDTLAQSSDDMQNLLNSAAIATLFLDHQLRIKRFTAEATKLFKLLPSDIGRPIGDLTSGLNYDQLPADAGKVLQKLGVLEKEVQTREGEWWQVRIHPYRTTANVIEGVIVTFVDIHQMKVAEMAVQEARADAESIVATVRQPLLVLDENLCVVSANRAYQSMFKTTSREVEHRLIYEVGRGRWNLPPLRHLLERVLPRKKAIEDFKIEQEFPGVGRKTLRLNARQLQRAAGAAKMILLAIEDITPSRIMTAKPPRRRK